MCQVTLSASDSSTASTAMMLAFLMFRVLARATPLTRRCNTPLSKVAAAHQGGVPENPEMSGSQLNGSVWREAHVNIVPKATVC
jgi:hypothetical protein